jgi:hypothetical protein
MCDRQDVCNQRLCIGRAHGGADGTVLENLTPSERPRY